MGNILNNTFVQKIIDISTQLGQPTGDPLNILNQTMERWSGKNNVSNFKLKPVSTKRVHKLFNSLKTSHSECHYSMSNYLIKLSKCALVLPIKHLINCCFEQGYFPNKWRIAKIIALFKCKGKNNDPSMYRPIALLNPISKLLEKEIFWQINEHMDSNRLWCPDLNAYREKHSTTHVPCSI